MSRVLVIGGGITGAGVARDLSLRGAEVTLVEREMPAAGATGRCHGLLHSGARYAVKDPKSAAECARENRTLKTIASHCIEDTGGVFLAITESDVQYGESWIPACKRSGIEVAVADRQESPNPAARACIAVNDAAVDPFLLTLSNLYDAYRNGAKILVNRSVKKIGEGYAELDGGEKLVADVIVNASGYECARLLSRSGVPAPAVQPDKGTLLVTEHRVCDQVVNRMRMPSDGDIVVPGHTTSIIGTTSAHSESTIPSRDEYRKILREAVMLLPSLKGMRITRAFSGIRPLLGSGEGRSLSRDYEVLENKGIVTIAGGKLTTYRLVAEHATDAVMRLTGEKGRCVTGTEQLPDVRQEECGEIECRCESAGRRIIPMEFLKGVDMGKYNRIGFGACQGMRCSKHTNAPAAFLQERWKGMKPVIEEGQMQQAYVSWAAYRTRMGDRWPR